MTATKTGKPKGRGKAVDHCTLERIERISHLYATRHSQAAIAKAEGISQATVSRCIARCQEMWRASSAINFNERVSVELAKIDALELDAQEAYRRSMLGHRKQSTKTTRGPAAKDGDAGAAVVTGTETTVTVEVQVGDPRFLERVGWCIDRRAKMLGLDAPSRIAQTTEVQFTDVRTDAEIDAAIADVEGRIARAQGRTVPPAGPG